MQFKENTPEFDQARKLRWLIFFRFLFALVLLASTAFVGIRENLTFFTPPLFFINLVALAAVFLSLIYSIALWRTRHLLILGYIQIVIDTVLVTAIIFFTGGFSSLFSFLYILVIIYASMVLFRRGGMAAAVLCSIEYGVMVDFEYYGIIMPLNMGPNSMIVDYDWNYVVIRMLVTMAACFAVAFLAGYLSEQEKRARRDLWAMEAQVKRVEKLAAIGETAAGLAHEIKNPLASMSGAIQVLKEEVPYDRDHKRLMEIVLREADRISALVNEFLMFARPQPGNKKKVFLDRELAEIIRQFEAGKLNRGHEIRESLSPDVVVEIDPEHLRQVVWNLLLNAVESMDGRGEIELGLESLQDSYARITVADKGCGMEEEIQQSIFDPFFTKKSKGTGLGLSIVQRILSTYNGVIDVESSPGQGSRFSVKLPTAGMPGDSDRPAE